MPLFCDCTKVRLEAARALLRGFDQPRLADVYAVLDQRLLNGEAPTAVGRSWAEQCLTWVDEHARLSQENQRLVKQRLALDEQLYQLKLYQHDEISRQTAAHTLAWRTQAQTVEAELRQVQAQTSAQIARLTAEVDALTQQHQQAEALILDLKRLLAKYHLSASDELTVREAEPPARKPRA